MAYEKRSVAGYMWRQQAWVFALLILAGFGLGAVKVAAHQLAAQFSAEGVEVIGAVSNMQNYTSEKRETFRIAYSFATPADPYNNGIQSVSEAFYDAQTDGGPIPVIYLPTDPTVNVVELSKLSNGFWITMAAAVSLIVAGAIGAYFAASRAYACVQLRKSGKVATATVTKHAIEGKKKQKARLEWRDAAGETGQSYPMLLADLPEIGSSITLFIDPDDRQKSVWEGEIGSR
jgi:predicted membrane-bound mannosyltransferase